MFFCSDQNFKSWSKSRVDKPASGGREGLYKLWPGSNVTELDPSTHGPALFPVAAGLRPEQGETCWQIISHTDPDKQQPHVHKCRRLNSQQSANTPMWMYVNWRACYKEEGTPCRWHHTCMSVIATYHQGFHRSASPIQHPAQNSFRAAQYLNNLSNERTKPLCVYRSHTQWPQSGLHCSKLWHTSYLITHSVF